MSAYQLMLLLVVSLLLVQLSESLSVRDLNPFRRSRGRRRCSPRNCEWKNWSAWGHCNHPCGNAGTRSRSRSVGRGSKCGGKKCPGDSKMSQGCNRFCHHGGSPRAGRCACPDVFWGTCCGRRKSHMPTSS